MKNSTVRILWSRIENIESQYKELVTWANKSFGLTGDRFTICSNIGYVDFVFTNNKDALIMAIMWNGRIVSDEELTVELVGSFLN